MKASTDEVYLKRAILTGNPFKVRRKLATVRHMFADPRDVLVGVLQGIEGSGSSLLNCVRVWVVWAIFGNPLVLMDT